MNQGLVIKDGSKFQNISNFALRHASLSLGWVAGTTEPHGQRYIEGLHCTKEHPVIQVVIVHHLQTLENKKKARQPISIR